MGVYTSSHYVTARKDYTCIDCGGTIARTARHLYFQNALIRKRVCERCSVRVDDKGMPVYYCRAVVDKIRRGEQLLRKTKEP